MNKLSFYLLNLKYQRALSKSDDNVISISPQLHKDNRPFVGIIILVNNKNIVYRFLHQKINLIRKVRLILLRFLILPQKTAREHLN